MITINLLPEQYRKATPSPIQQFHRSPLALGVGGLLVALAVLLMGLVQMRGARLAQLTARLAQLEHKKTELNELKAAVQQLRERQAVFRRLTRERSRWARHLNTLADVIPEGVWLTDLVIDQMKGLVIQGAAIGQGGEEMVRIGRLVQDLKNDPAFAAAIRDIQIESIKNIQEREVEVIEFTLTAALATTSTAAKP
jgi:Tfp pilus assembly protein PilN